MYTIHTKIRWYIHNTWYIHDTVDHTTPTLWGGVILVLLPPKNKTHKHTYTFQQWPIVDSTLACGLKAMLCLAFI